MRSAGLLLALVGLSAALQIQNLPGAPAVNFKQYSGYYTVGDTKNHQLHYWFVESQNNPATDPVLVWLTGGPGCSGLSALLTEWGPFMVNGDGATLSNNPYSWNLKASILTLESPAGVGYSYATDGKTATSDTQTANENWQALVAFFNEFPQYKNNDFYVTGESYGEPRVNGDGATLSNNPYSWNLKASILTLESPAGVGYSYATDGKTATSDTQTANENWQALVAFFNEFPQYKNNDFYVTGESYGGIYVPTLVQTILDNQAQSPINIKGFAIGNGCVSSNEGTDALVLFMHAHGMVDETKWQRVVTECCNNDTDSCPFHSFNGFNFCGEFVVQTTNMAWGGGINPYNMYDSCDSQSATETLRFASEAERRGSEDVVTSQLSTPTCMNESAVTVYLNRQDVRTALGIPKTVKAWEICSNIKYTEQFHDMTGRFQNAVNKGLRAMLYSGDVDMACNFLMGQRFSRKLGFPLVTQKKEYQVGGQVGGFHTQYKGVDFVTVRGAGHMVPTDKPAVAYHVIDSFLNKKPF